MPVLHSSNARIQNKEKLGAKNDRLVHEAGHVGWMKDAANEKQTVVMGIRRCKQVITYFDLVVITMWLWYVG